jgi:hypothetical protein
MALGLLQKNPAGQGAQVTDEFAPMAPLYSPSAQEVHPSASFVCPSI